MIPTSWLLGLFTNPDIFHPTDLWTRELLDCLLDRVVVEGHSVIVVFVLVALLEMKEETILERNEEETLRETLLALPWSLMKEEIEMIMKRAEELLSTTPVSTLYAIASLISQCSPGLLTQSVPGSLNLWYSRMYDLYK